MIEFKTKLEPFARGFINCESDYFGKKCAAGWVQQAKEGNIKINMRTGLCTIDNDSVLFNYTGLWCFDELKDEFKDHPEDKEDLDIIAKEIEPWTQKHNLSRYLNDLESRNYCEGHITGGYWEGHAVPDFVDVCRYGTDYLREKIEANRALNPGKDDFYDSCILSMDVFDILGERYSNLAKEYLKNRTDPEEVEKLNTIIRTFDHAPQRPCRDFAEAVIVLVMVLCVDGNDSPGYFDQYMYDFWKVTDSDIRRKYLDAIWEYFHETRIWNLTIAGSDENWNDMSNDLTYAILDIVTEKKYQTPNLTARLHRNSPKKLIEAIYRSLATGCGLPGIYNDEAVCVALERLGIPPVDSHRYVMNGCNQIDIQGKSHMGLEDGEVIMAKAVEFTLFNGVSGKTGNKLGLETGDPTTFESFDEFYDAFTKQMDYMINVIVGICNAAQKEQADNIPGPLRSVLIEGCLEKGLEYKNRGPIYGHGQILIQAFAETVDSLANIKKYVYDDKRYTMAEVVDAMNKDYVGYDEMYHTFKNSEMKFGNDIEYVDSIARDVMDHFNSELLKKPTYRGGFYSSGCSPFVNAPGAGRKLGTLPNGLKTDECLIADSIGATPGCDTHGPTALLNSCLSFDQTLPGSGFILNLKFDRAIFNSSEGEEVFESLLKSYFDRKGQMVTATVVSREELLDAQIHPEDHRDLIVRVGGYCDYFVNINKSLQENVIARTSHCGA